MIKTIIAMILVWYIIKILNMIPIARWLQTMLDWIWNQKVAVKAETLQRIRELYVDGNVPAETAILVSSTEAGITPHDIYVAVGAVDAEDVINILTGKGFSIRRILSKMIKKARRAKL